MYREVPCLDVSAGRGGLEQAEQRRISNSSYWNSSPRCFRRECRAHWLAECSPYSGGSHNVHHDSHTLGLGARGPIRAKDATGYPLTKTSDSGLGGPQWSMICHHWHQISNLKAQIYLWRRTLHLLRYNSLLTECSGPVSRHWKAPLRSINNGNQPWEFYWQGGNNSTLSEPW